MLQNIFESVSDTKNTLQDHMLPLVESREHQQKEMGNQKGHERTQHKKRWRFKKNKIERGKGEENPAILVNRYFSK